MAQEGNNCGDQRTISLGPVVNILAIFSNANNLKNKRIKIYHIKGIGWPLLISIDIDAWGLGGISFDKPINLIIAYCFSVT